jgi:hypothetical protein
MTKTKGVLLFAKNNKKLDYVKQAIFLATRVKKYLNLPVAIATDSPEYLKLLDKKDIIDEVICIESNESVYSRRYYDGAVSSKIASFNNNSRCLAYDLTPYEETLVMDTDFIVSNDIFKNCFDMSADFQIYKQSTAIDNERDATEFVKISDSSVDFYWATVVFFRKTPLNRIFFDLVKHIQEEWIHYRMVYQIESPMFRNDFAFSIAIHIINGFQNGDFAQSLPGSNIYSIDKELLLSIKDDMLTFLIEKKDCLGEYTAVTTKGQNVHVMNKFSLERIID